MILLTGFKPFAGRERNGSASAARHLGGAVVGGEPVASEVFEVVWGEPERRLPELTKKLRPVLLLGLGEGSGDALRFERRATNRASGLDEVGAPSPHGPVLKTGGCPELVSTMSFDPAWIADLAPAKNSDDAGAFLCNAWLYEAIRIADCPTAFIHLPVQGDLADEEYASVWAPAIREILERNLTG